MYENANTRLGSYECNDVPCLLVFEQKRDRIKGCRCLVSRNVLFNSLKVGDIIVFKTYRAADSGVAAAM
jgi:hypothetical protein